MPSRFWDGTSKSWVSSTSASGTWDADKLAIARGFYEVLSSTAPTQQSYTASDGKVYPVVWIKAEDKVVPVLPVEPSWNDQNSTITVQPLVGVTYKIIGITPSGGTFQTADVTVPPDTAFSIKTVGTLPFTATVKAYALPGYYLPTDIYQWTHDYPDPTATVVMTSDTFITEGSLSAVKTSAALGGSQYTYASGMSGNVVGGMLSSGTAWLDFPGTTNFEVEFDAVSAPASGDPKFTLSVATVGNNNYNKGARFLAARADTGISRVYDGTAEIKYGSLGTTIYGHWKVNVVQNTFNIYPPGVTSPWVYTLTSATVGSANRGTAVVFDATNMNLDNLVFKKVGF